MKTLIFLAVAFSVTSASANSYWYDYCDVTKAASDFVVSNENGQSVNPAHCNRTAYVIPERATCLQSIKSVSLFGKRATYEVEVKTEQGKSYFVKVKAKMDSVKMCTVRSLSYSQSVDVE